MRIVPLTPEIWSTFADWFGSRDSSPDGRWCWCMYWRRRGLDWTNSSADGNRADLEALTCRPQGPAPGLVALDDDGRAIGWISVGPRTEYERIERSRRLPRLDERPVWTVVCFVVARSTRRRGITRALLDAAIEYARTNGAPALEAYPADPGDARLPAAAAYTGLRRVFEAAGFEKVADTASRAGGYPRVAMRMELGGGSAGSHDTQSDEG
jgi:GNAT superfamily N-acetyltransferase